MRRRRSAIPFAALAWALCFSCFKVLSPTSFIAPPKSRPALESSAGLAVAAAGAAFEAGTSPAMAQQETFAFVGKSSADLFPLPNLSILTWLLLIVAPGWEYTKSAALVAPVINAVMYVIVVAFLITHPPPDAPAVDFGSLSSIVTAFQNPDGVFAGWLHYCVFDPLVGLGEVLDSQQNKVPHALVAPCLKQQRLPQPRSPEPSKFPPLLAAPQAANCFARYPASS